MRTTMILAAVAALALAATARAQVNQVMADAQRVTAANAATAAAANLTAVTVGWDAGTTRSRDLWTRYWAQYNGMGAMMRQSLYNYLTQADSQLAQAQAYWAGGVNMKNSGDASFTAGVTAYNASSFQTAYDDFTDAIDWYGSNCVDCACTSANSCIAMAKANQDSAERCLF